VHNSQLDMYLIFQNTIMQNKGTVTQLYTIYNGHWTLLLKISHKNIPVFCSFKQINVWTNTYILL